jgi:hypothetical protein
MYTKTKKLPKWVIGLIYERIVAKQLRKGGWEVSNRGKYGVHDHGIDLIATKNDVTRYIQCKGWDHKKSIHVDVVNQFYGSVISVTGPDDLKNVEMYIYANAHLDAYAQDVAKRHNIAFVLQRFRD